MDDETQGGTAAEGTGETPAEQSPGAATPQTQDDRSEAPGTADAPGETGGPLDVTPAGAALPPNPAADREPPAPEQSPVATDRDKVIVGSSGLFDQQPAASLGDPDTPLRTSAPPAQMQSGVPIPVADEDEGKQ